MSSFAENETVHEYQREITQLDPTSQAPSSPDSGQGDSSSNPSNSEDSSEEKKSSTDKKRNKLKVRSVSYSSDSCKEYRGILKYHGRRLRSLSESCAEQYNGSNGLSSHGESLSALDECWYEEEMEEEDDDEDGEDGPKVKKTVRFSEVVHKQLFRSNSSILGQRKKNQRKQSKKKKAAASRSPSSTSSTPPAHQLSSSVDSVNDDDDEDEDEGQSENGSLNAMSDALDCVNLSDSGVEVNSDSDPCPEVVTKVPSNNGRPNKKSKKHKKSQSRQRRASESAVNEMIFHLDL